MNTLTPLDLILMDMTRIGDIRFGCCESWRFVSIRAARLGRIGGMLALVSDRWL